MIVDWMGNSVDARKERNDNRTIAYYIDFFLNRRIELIKKQAENISK